MFRSKNKILYDMGAIHQLSLDLERISLLRDKCKRAEEQQRYNTCIEVMQHVLTELLGSRHEH